MRLRIPAILAILVLFSFITITKAQTSTLTNGLVGYWKFDSINNLTITDDSGSGNAGTVGTGARLVPGKFGQALKFDKGLKGQHMVTGKAFMSPTWSVSMWVNPDVPIPIETPYFGNITLFSGTGLDFLSLRNTDVALYRNKIADFNFAASPTWHHIVFTYDGAKITAYVDGVNRGSYATTTNILGTSAQRFIGTPGAANSGHIFLGSIDEVRLYNRAITAGEVTSLFNPVTNPPITVPPVKAPTTKFADNLTVTTDRNSYKPGDNITMTANFTLNNTWVQYLRTNNISEGEIRFAVRGQDNKFLLEKTFAFNIDTKQIQQQYVWATPVNSALAGSKIPLEVSVYDAQKTVTVSIINNDLSFGQPVSVARSANAAALPVSPDVVTSRLPAGVSPYLYGKITAERDLSNEFTLAAPYTFTKDTRPTQAATIWFTPKNQTLDLSDYNALWLTVENQSDVQTVLNLLPHSVDLDDSQHAIWSIFAIPGNSGMKHILLTLVDPMTNVHRCGAQNGMQRCPIGPDQIPASTQDKGPGFTRFNKGTFNRFRIYVRDMSPGGKLVVHSIKAVNINYRPSSIPGYIDRWGQNNWTNFEGKINSDQELQAQGARESATPNPLPANWDQYGGDTRYGGYNATGFFRTEKIDGKWWLISPDGNLFYLNGQNWVTHRTWATTITNRTSMITGAPAATGKYTPTYENSTCVPENNNPGGTGEFCGGLQWLPYFANIVTKYSTPTNTMADILRKWGIVTKNRLYDWGFNSVLTTGTVPQNMRIAYTLMPGMSNRPGVPRIPNTNVPEVFAPGYKVAVDAFMDEFANRWNIVPGTNLRSPQDPYNIGVYTDNEIDFGRGPQYGPESATYYLPTHVLKLNGMTSASKNAFTNKLREKYVGFDRIKSAWGQTLSGVNSWEQFNIQSITGAVPKEDLSLLLRYYSDEYFRIAREISKKYFPNQLFLGSRFASFWRAPNESVDACAQYCDVISINYYGYDVTPSLWNHMLSKDKPVLLSETHIGILSRGGAFGGHYWVIGEDLAAEKYKQYMRSVVAKDQIVGYYYHSYADMPLSGINFDSENMYASFVTTTDQPKQAMVSAARDIHSRVFSSRNARPNSGVTRFTVTTQKAGTGTGSITGTGINCGDDCTETQNRGTVNTLTATASEGSTFTGWSGACTNTSGSCAVTLDANKTVTATFTRINTAPTTQPVTVSTNGAAVTINYVASDAENDPITYNNGVAPTRGRLAPVPNTTGRFTYTPNTPLPSTAYTDTYNYNATDGRLTSPATRVTINYTPRQYVLTVNKTGNGLGSITGTGINCGDDCNQTMNTGLSNTLTATALQGYSFTGWSGACTNTTGTCVVSMTQDRAVTANFVVTNTAPVAQGASYTTTGAPLEITLTANDTPGDTLTFAPTTISTPLATLTRVREGVYRYTLKTPLPTVRSTDTFTFTASDGRLTSAPATVSVVFTPTPPTQFSLNTVVNGSGTITGTGINCGSDCSERVNTGTTITLTARPLDGHTFSGWTGACTNTSGTCVVVVNADKTVTARFTAIPPADTDADGVPNTADACPRTPQNLRTQVNTRGCVRPRMTRFNIRPAVEGDLTAVNNVELGISNVGKVKFNAPVSLSRADGVIDLDTHIVIENEKVEVKSASVPELNKPSTITMYGVTKTIPRILKDGQECTAPACNIESYENGVLVFTVSGFSTYTIGESFVPPPENPNPDPEPEPERRRSRGGGGGGSSRTNTSTVSNETLIQQLTAQLNLLIAQLNALTGGITVAPSTPIAVTYGKFNTTLSFGSRHPDVKRLQQKLTSLGYPVSATGYYGQQTVAAVKRFQAANGISQTGAAGVLTRAVLNQ